MYMCTIIYLVLALLASFPSSRTFNTDGTLRFHPLPCVFPILHLCSLATRSSPDIRRIGTFDRLRNLKKNCDANPAPPLYPSSSEFVNPSLSERRPRRRCVWCVYVCVCVYMCVPRTKGRRFNFVERGRLSSRDDLLGHIFDLHVITRFPVRCPNKTPPNLYTARRCIYKKEYQKNKYICVYI